MVHIKENLLLTGNNSHCSGSSGFPLSLSEWSFTIWSTPYNSVNKMSVNVIIHLFISVCVYLAVYFVMCIFYSVSSAVYFSMCVFHFVFSCLF